MTKKLLLMMVAFTFSYIGLFGYTWYSRTNGTFTNPHNFRSSRDGTGTAPTWTNISNNDVWVVQSGHSMFNDLAGLGEYGTGSGVIIEAGGILNVESDLLAQDSTKFSYLNVYGQFYSDGDVRVTTLKVFDGGELYLWSLGLDVTNFYIYGGGTYIHSMDDGTVPGTNRYFADSNNGGNGNGTLKIVAQGTGGLTSGITWGNVVIDLWTGTDDVNGGGAFTNVQGDFTVNDTGYSEYRLMGTETTTLDIKGNLTINRGKLVLKNGINDATINVKKGVKIDGGTLTLTKSGGVTFSVGEDFEVVTGSFIASTNTNSITTLWLEGSLNVGADADNFVAYNGTTSGTGYVNIYFSNNLGLYRSSDIKLKTGLDRYQSKWNISVNNGRTLNLKSDVEIGTTNASIYYAHLYFTVDGGGYLKPGTYKIKNASGTYDEGYEPNFMLSSLGNLYITSSSGITTSGTEGHILVTGSRSYDSGANYFYCGSSAQNTGNGLSAANYVDINNAAGLTLSADLTCNFLHLENGVFNTDGHKLTVTGNITFTNGSFAPGCIMTVDGYYNAGGQYLTITENDVNITDFSVSTSNTGTFFPNRIKRSWTLNGTQSGGKNYNFTWTAEDDNNFNWNNWSNPVSPVIYQGSTPLMGFGWGRSISVYIENLSSAKGVFTIGRSDGQQFEGALPVELSSFSAVLNTQGVVCLQWITQSETDILGYNIYRSESDVLPDAILVSPLLYGTNSSTQHSYEFQDDEITQEGIYFYWLQSVEFNGTNEFHGPVSVHVLEQGDPNTTPVIPTLTMLNPAYPNPFNPQTNISFDLKTDSFVNITIYNAKGGRVLTLTSKEWNAGKHHLVWNGKDDQGRTVSSGVYFYRMTAGKYKATQKVVLLK